MPGGLRVIRHVPYVGSPWDPTAETTILDQGRHIGGLLRRQLMKTAAEQAVGKQICIKMNYSSA